MVMFRCLIQAGQIDDAQREKLNGHLTEAARELCAQANEPVPITWVEVAEGFGFTAGKPSRSSVVVSAIPDETPQEDRVVFMKRICDAWSQETGCSINDVVATAVNVSLAARAKT